jgi:hypothetical protein
VREGIDTEGGRAVLTAELRGEVSPKEIRSSDEIGVVAQFRTARVILLYYEQK